MGDQHFKDGNLRKTMDIGGIPRDVPTWMFARTLWIDTPSSEYEPTLLLSDEKPLFAPRAKEELNELYLPDLLEKLQRYGVAFENKVSPEHFEMMRLNHIIEGLRHEQQPRMQINMDAFEGIQDKSIENCRAIMDRWHLGRQHASQDEVDRAIL